MPDARAAAVAQDVLLAFLEDPAPYPHGPDQVEVVQTHASYVALAPPYVYKVKKPVDLGFLDFSTLEQRHHFCEVEVELNSRLCAPIYEGVVRLVQRDGELAWEADGDVVEYAVKMKQLPDGGFLHQHLERDELAQTDLDRLIDKLAIFYRNQEPSATVAERGRLRHLKRNTDENFEQTEHLAGELFSQAAFDTIRYYTDRFYDHHIVLLNRRRTGGHIVDGHGDLHLEHIHLSAERVCIYDCIEFNERFRHLDVANDVAFLAMDLDYHERRHLARYFIEQMSRALDDPDLPKLADFYKCYRAYVRAKVEGMRSAEEEVPAAERKASRERAIRYYQLALRYAVAGSTPAAVVVMGRVGTGKSMQAQALSEALGWPVLSSDRVRKEQAGVPLYERGDAAQRARLYTREMTERTYAALRDQALEHVRQGRGVLLDATYSHRQQRDQLRAILRREEVPCYFAELTAPDEAVRERLQQRAAAAQVVSDARLEDFDLLSARYEAPDALEDALHFPVPTEGAPQDTTRVILRQLVRLADRA